MDQLVTLVLSMISTQNILGLVSLWGLAASWLFMSERGNHKRSRAKIDEMVNRIAAFADRYADSKDVDQQLVRSLIELVKDKGNHA
jgi:cell division protein FtsW (lipid II flippase)